MKRLAVALFAALALDLLTAPPTANAQPAVGSRSGATLERLEVPPPPAPPRQAESGRPAMPAASPGTSPGAMPDDSAGCDPGAIIDWLLDQRPRRP